MICAYTKKEWIKNEGKRNRKTKIETKRFYILKKWEGLR